MRDVYLVVAIVSHPYSDRFTRFYRECGIASLLGMPGEGTAKHDLLDLLGLEATQKSVLYGVATGEVKKKFMRGVVRRLNIDLPGTGIAFSIPVGSVGGAAFLDTLLAGQMINESEERSMQDIPYALIMAIANSGHTDEVMDAARTAGARGGTILHAKGTGSSGTQKFYGMTIAEEKEVVIIAAAKAHAPEIMKAIMAKCGANSKAHAKCMSLPVDSIAGFSPEESEE